MSEIETSNNTEKKETTEVVRENQSYKERSSYRKPQSDDDDDEDKGMRLKDNDGKFKKNTKYKRKVCKFCSDKVTYSTLDYKKTDLLEKFVTNRGKILPRRITGTCAKHQRELVREIKKSRSIGLLAFKVM